MNTSASTIRTRPLCIPRVPHECRLCGELIPAGQPCVRWTGFFENKPFTSHAHPGCYGLTTNWDSSDWESVLPGDIERPAINTAIPNVDATSVSARYYELIYAVVQKYEGESRHETALRYIRERESHNNTSPLAQAIT